MCAANFRLTEFPILKNLERTPHYNPGRHRVDIGRIFEGFFFVPLSKIKKRYRFEEQKKNYNTKCHRVIVSLF